MRLELHPEVRDAIDEGRAVVALESTILAHGLPWPDNLEIGRALEAEVRAGGAVPATIAVLGGRAHIGLDDAALEKVARGGAAFRKAGAADLAVLLARGGDAATTVAGTVHLAAHAGIRLMATGGIGGVHRGAPWDVSNDLAELAARQVAVVSAGAKAILDLPKTAEMLETLGVLLVGVRTSELPAFYTPWSGVPLEHRVEDAAQAAAVLRMRWRLGQGGVLLCNPIPAAAALEPAFVDAIIVESLAAAERAGVRGKAVTPYLLADLERKSGGRTVQANRALALANARLAAEVAVAEAAAALTKL
jgi:pseudouridine-5'-phosphate glycosidase